MEELKPCIKTFIAGYCERYKIGKINPDELSLETSIDLDLDIADIEIELFLAEFTAHFKVDDSRFTWYKYGYPKGSLGVKMLKSVFGYDKRWVKRLSRRIYQPKFKVRNLQEAVNTGRLL